MVAYKYKVIGCFVCLIGLMSLIFLLAGCNDATQASSRTAATRTPVGTRTAPTRPNNGRNAQATVVVSQSPVSGNRSGTGPIVISTPTISAKGGSSKQLVTLADRTLTFGHPSWKAGAANTFHLSLTVNIENTGSKAINNAITYYQLVSAEGDTFGLAPGTSPTFFGQISSHNQRSSTLTFVVPAAANNLRLLYRPEVASETVLFPLASRG